jgi:ABC-2 type transport system ATP-binding protein
MKRRLDLASALVHGPRLLFLDEPTEGLDPASRQAVWQEVQRLNKEFGVTVFLTTHYLEEADRLSDRVAIIDRGVIVAEGKPSELKATIGGGVVSIGVEPARLPEARRVLSDLEGLRDIRADGGALTLFVNDGAGIIAHVVRLLDTAHVPVESVAISEPTLDEVFLRATGSRLEGAGDGRGGSDG